jgi:hypothetical protein
MPLDLRGLSSEIIVSFRLEKVKKSLPDYLSNKSFGNR